LAVPQDARVIDTTSLEQEQVIERIITEVQSVSSRGLSGRSSGGGSTK
jgi:cytidylate kinase